jgi:hypothetical protein
LGRLECPLAGRGSDHPRDPRRHRGAGPARRKATSIVLLVVLGVREDGQKVPGANPPEQVSGIVQIRTMRFCIGFIAGVLMLLVHTERGLTETGHNFVTRVYVGNAGETDEST